MWPLKKSAVLAVPFFLVSSPVFLGATESKTGGGGTALQGSLGGGTAACGSVLCREPGLLCPCGYSKLKPGVTHHVMRGFFF